MKEISIHDGKYDVCDGEEKSSPLMKANLKWLDFCNREAIRLNCYEYVTALERNKKQDGAHACEVMEILL